MITKQTKDYGDLFKRASETLRKYNVDHKLISEAGGEPILKTNYVEVEVTEDDYSPNEYYILSDGKYILDKRTTFTPNETYYYDASERITSLDEYFSYIEDLNIINRRYTILPLDEDPFVIDANTRTITVPKSFRDNGISVQGDEAAETIYFKIDRFFDATDLDMMDIYIQWRSSEVDENGKPVEKVSPIWVKDIESQPGYIIFGWAISSKATAVEGKIQFSVRFFKYDEEEERLTYSLATLPCTAEIKPSLDFNLPEIIKDKVDIDDPNDLISNRFVNSTGVTGGVPAIAPLFLKDLGEDGIPFTDEKDRKAKELFLDKATGTKVDYVEAVSLDGGAITYTWKKYNIDTGTREQGKGADGEDVMPYETTYILTKDTSRNDKKVYYIPATSGDGVQGYTQYLGSIPPENDSVEVYEKVSQGTMKTVGKYMVTSTNRVKQNRKTTDSTIVYIKRPSEVVIANKGNIVDKDNAVIASAIVPFQDPDSDVPTSTRFFIKASTQDTVDKKPNELTYQWYKKNINSDPKTDDDWVAIGTNGKSSSYEVFGEDDYVQNEGRKGDGYYKAIVTNTLNKETTSTSSSVCRVTHPATAMNLTETDLAMSYKEACKTGFVVKATAPADAYESRTAEDTVTYQWYRYRRSNSATEQADEAKAEKQEYKFDGDYKLEGYTSPVFKPTGHEDWVGYKYFCEVTNVYNGSKAVKCSRFFILNKDSDADDF